MAVTQIVMVEEINTYPDFDYDEPPQGVEYELVRIYKIENDDSDDQYFKFVITLDSYGNAGGNYGSVEHAIPKTFIPVNPVDKTVTVFK